MAAMQWLVFGFVLACVRLNDARFLRTSKSNYWGPQRGPSRESTRQTPMAVGPLPWKFPDHPADVVKKLPIQSQPPPQQQQQTQTAAAPTRERVAVRCGESRIRVEVSQDLMGVGRLIRPEDLTLGGCPATGIDERSHVLIFDYELHSCGSRLVMTKSSFVYAFMLLYEPKVSGVSPITRNQSARIGVECHY